VDEKKAAAMWAYQGRTYYFCAPGCKAAFVKAPDKYVAAQKAEKKGRSVTGTGRKFLDTTSREVLLALAAKNPELMKYGRAK